MPTVAAMRSVAVVGPVALVAARRRLTNMVTVAGSTVTVVLRLSRSGVGWLVVGCGGPRIPRSVGRLVGASGLHLPSGWKVEGLGGPGSAAGTQVRIEVPSNSGTGRAEACSAVSAGPLALMSAARMYEVSCTVAWLRTSQSAPANNRTAPTPMAMLRRMFWYMDSMKPSMITAIVAPIRIAM